MGRCRAKVNNCRPYANSLGLKIKKSDYSKAPNPGSKHVGCCAHTPRGEDIDRSREDDSSYFTVVQDTAELHPQINMNPTIPIRRMKPPLLLFVVGTSVPGTYPGFR